MGTYFLSMKSTLYHILSVFALGVSMAAGGVTSSSKMVTNPIPLPPLPEEVFGVGPFVSIFAAGNLHRENRPQFGGNFVDDGIGGGLSVGYFFTRNLGLELSGDALDTRSVDNDLNFDADDDNLYEVTAALLVRAPYESIRLAPYAMFGAGGGFDGASQGIWFAGGGLEYRLPGSGRYGLFSDARYTWAAVSNDYVLIRLGLRYSF
jgi:hypothetical protein